jgi:hypothetical protein
MTSMRRTARYADPNLRGGESDYTEVLLYPKRLQDRSTALELERDLGQGGWIEPFRLLDDKRSAHGARLVPFIGGSWTVYLEVREGILDGVALHYSGVEYGRAALWRIWSQAKALFDLRYRRTSGVQFGDEDNFSVSAHWALSRVRATLSFRRLDRPEVICRMTTRDRLLAASLATS